jgi:phosphoribosylformylglycinamidine synthase
LHAWLFGEDQARYLLAVPAEAAAEIVARAASVGVPARIVGATGGATLTVAGAGNISLGELSALHEGWLPAYMAGA